MSASDGVATSPGPVPLPPRGPLALTMGDPAGIGPELAIAAWLARRPGDAPFFVLAPPAFLADVARRIGADVPIVETGPRTPARSSSARCRSRRSPPVAAEPGRPSAANAAATLELIERAVQSVREGHARAVVTNPIAKATLYEAGFPHPGHTEYLGALAAAAWGAPATPVMMIWSDALAVVPVTIHIALADVPRALTRARIVETARIVDRDLRRRFGIARPRLAVAGLNPHAGEGGAMGREEIETVAPAIAALRAEGIDASGPLPADTMFHPKARAATTSRSPCITTRASSRRRRSPSTRPSTSRSACRSCAPRPTTARPSTSPGKGSPIRRA